MSNLNKVGKPRVHRERAQPASRKKFGLLQKHSDYVERARNHNLKQKRLRALRERAALRNPDEFYHGMIRVQTDNGIHRIVKLDERTKASPAVRKQLANRDVAYLELKRMQEINQIEKLRNSLHFIDEAMNDTKQCHILFGARKNIHKEKQHLPVNNNEDEKHREQRLRAYKVLEARNERLKALDDEIKAIHSERHQMDTTKALRIVKNLNVFGEEDEDSTVILKWKKERKK